MHNVNDDENFLRAYTRRAFRKCGLPCMSYYERLAFLDMSSLECSCFVSCLTMFFKIYHHFAYCNVLNNLILQSTCQICVVIVHA